MSRDPLKLAVEMLCPIDESDCIYVERLLGHMVNQYRRALAEETMASPEKIRPAARKALRLLKELTETLSVFPSAAVSAEIPKAFHALEAMDNLQRALARIEATPGRRGNAFLWARRELIQESMLTLMRRGLPSGSAKIRALAILVHEAVAGKPPSGGNWKRLSEDVITHRNQMLFSEEAIEPFAMPWPFPTEPHTETELR